MTYPIIRLHKGKEDSILRQHPWVFSGAIASAPEGLDEGDIVEVHTSDGTPLGLGHYQIGSIMVRIMAFAAEGVSALDEAYYAQRLQQAHALREALGLIRPDNNAYRLCHGEGDFVPGLIVDIYGTTAVVQAHSVGIHYARNVIAGILADDPRYGVNAVYYKSETTLPFKAHLEARDGYLIGHADSAVAMENGLLFNIDWLKGQKTGFFLDQRDNRQLLQRYSHERRVLNMFCYTGGFSVYALRGGAESVVSVDSSEKAVELTRANIALNFPGAVNHEAVATDAFKYLDQMEPAAYDLIVLDPPAFAKHRKALGNALKGYTRLNAAAIQKIAPGGIIFTFSCSQAVTREQFRLAVFTAAARTGRRVRILHQLTQPADHPVNIYHPEGEYLKGLILSVE